MLRLLLGISIAYSLESGILVLLNWSNCIVCFCSPTQLFPERATASHNRTSLNSLPRSQPRGRPFQGPGFGKNTVCLKSAVSRTLYRIFQGLKVCEATPPRTQDVSQNGHFSQFTEQLVRVENLLQDRDCKRCDRQK